MDHCISRCTACHTNSIKEKKCFKKALKTLFYIQRCRLTFAVNLQPNPSAIAQDYRAQVTHKILQMEQKKKYKGIWLLVFLASTAALIFAIYTHWEWLTLILPFQTTALVKALDIM